MRMPSSAPSLPVSKKSRKSKHKRSAVEQQPVRGGKPMPGPPATFAATAATAFLLETLNVPAMNVANLAYQERMSQTMLEERSRHVRSVPG